MQLLYAATQRNVNRALREIKAFEREGDYRPQARLALKAIMEGQMDQERTAFVGRTPYGRGEPAREYRNGYWERGLQTELGEIRLRVPRVRSGKFFPTAIRRFERRALHITRAIVQVFTGGLSTRKSARILAAHLGIEITAQTVSRLGKILDAHVQRFHRRQLENRYRFLFFDGVSLGRRGATEPVKDLVLCAYGIGHDGVPELIDYLLASSESTVNCEGFMNDLYRRGLTGQGVELAVTDGGPGLHAALALVYPRLARQRCWAHKVRNVLNRVRKQDHKAVKQALAAIWGAASLSQAKRAYWAFVNDLQSRYPEAVSCLRKDIEDLLAFFQVRPAAAALKGLAPLARTAETQRLWRTVRTTNPIERCFVEVRRRTRPMGTFQNKASMERILFSVFTYLNDTWAGRPLSTFTHNS